MAEVEITLIRRLLPGWDGDSGTDLQCSSWGMGTTRA